MNKLEYIPGDIVKIEYGEATGKIGFVTNTFLRRKGFYSLVVSISKGFQGSSKDDWIQTYNDGVSPIPLTPEILEKNGWKSINGKYALKIKYAKYVVLEFTEDGIYTYINENTMLFTIKYIHELQHLLYALHIDSNLKI